ncbi:hypothetical protein RvY_03501 [Ramazzottius varieornatus]|uniref:Uncharacterized protein n=1 Tax=Ramazzottius varieornatus TaxID=947166 RepID=A0A1D1US15_RAMVA|nr:hypothetical protein RvY_03501 [Ramazzottius varieornatus]
MEVPICFAEEIEIKQAERAFLCSAMAESTFCDRKACLFPDRIRHLGVCTPCGAAAKNTIKVTE